MEKYNLDTKLSTYNYAGSHLLFRVLIIPEHKVALRSEHITKIKSVEEAKRRKKKLKSNQLLKSYEMLDPESDGFQRVSSFDKALFSLI